MRKGVELALKIIFIGCILLVLVELKWLVQEQVFDRQDMDTLLEKGVSVGKRIMAQSSINGAIMVDTVRNSEIWQAVFD